MVPKGWDYKRLELVAELQRGFDLPSQLRIDGNVPILSSAGISGFHNEAKAKAPGIVTGRYGSIGDVFFVEKDYWPLNTSLWVKNFHGNHEKFIYYLLSAFDFKKFSDKTGVPGVNRNDLHEVKVRVPPVSEQKKIAKILSVWDKAITTTEQLLANSQQQKKALMQKLLTGKVRFSGFDDEWKEQQLGDICKPQQWATISSGNLIGSGYPAYGANGFIGYHTEYNHEFETVAVTCRGSTCGEVSLIPAKSYITGNSMCLDDIDSSKYIYIFIYQLLKLRGFNDVISGSAQPQIVGSAIRKIKLSLPNIVEQQKIAEVLSSADQEINLLQAKLNYLKQEKKALMQQLLTGKRRVAIN